MKTEIINLDGYTDWMKLLRVTSYVMKFCKRKSEKHGEVLWNPDEEIIKEAKNYWIRNAQKDLNEIKEKDRLKLTPFTDEEGIIRISGRLKNSPIFDNDRTHPKLLPGNHKISELIVKHIHEKLFHPGRIFALDI